MKSKNVTTLTRAMDHKNAKNNYNEVYNSKIVGIGDKQELRGRYSNSSTATSSSTSNDDVSLSGTSRSKQFKRNRKRSSIRTIQSLSKGSKGVDLMKSLWMQTGMIT